MVFIIRKDIEKEFKEVIGDRIASICSSHNVTVDYAFQDINDIPGTLPEGRTKPWGTGQAVLAAKDVIKTPFIVINADDYYGKEGFKAVHEYLVNGGKLPPLHSQCPMKDSASGVFSLILLCDKLDTLRRHLVSRPAPSDVLLGLQYNICLFRAIP